MLRLPRFQYLSPSSLEEACALLKEYEGNIAVLAGGTDLLPSLKQRSSAPDYVLDLRKVAGLNEIKNGSGKHVSIGALCTLTQLEESPGVIEQFPAVAEAAGLVAATQIKNMGTIGGNIALGTRCWYFNQSHFWRKSFEPCIKRGGEVCHVVKGSKKCFAYFAADTVPALIASNAQIILQSSEGERTCSLKEIYTQDGKTPHSIKPTEIIVRVMLPLPEKGSGSAYQKLRLRGAIDFPLLGVAVWVKMEGDTCREARIILGAVGSGPIQVAEAEDLLQGTTITEEVIEEVGEIARKASHPVANTISTPGYRKNMAAVFSKKALREAVGRARAQ
jgi:4-hydroxybenzoyl-CoA reductase subunit beta